MRSSGGGTIDLNMIDVTAILPIYGQPVLELTKEGEMEHRRTKEAVVY